MKIYIVLSDDFELDDCWHGAGSDIEYVSISKEKTIAFLNKMRDYYINKENAEVEYNQENRFSITIGNWSYNYDLLEVEEDTILRNQRK